ncbi:MAG: IS3 family transposase [Firmicutes bacterium]|nr:IS3 family transposase [Bacillota bacterium]
MNHKLVYKLMKECGLVCKVKCRKYKSYKGEVGKVAPNILNRDFEAEKPNEKYVTDVTEFQIGGERIYLSPIMDLYNREIVSYSIGGSPSMDLIKEMLEGAREAFSRGQNPVIHSDQGWQYQQKAYQNILASQGVRQSMSRKGNCLDNAVIENFFGTLKSETIYLEKIKTKEALIDTIVDYIEYYNNRRIKAKLKGLSPVQYRLQSSCSIT